MIADNLNLKLRRGNNARCVELCVHLKDNCIVTKKNLGWKIDAYSVDVGY